MKRKSSSSLSLSGPRWDMAAAVFFFILLFFCMHVWTESFAVGMAVLALVLCVGRTPWRLARERFCVPALGFLAFVVLYGISAVYSPFGASAPREFRGGLIAFAVAGLVLFRVEKRHVRKMLWVLAAICAAASVLCTDFACEGGLYDVFCDLMGLFNYAEEYRTEIANTIGRVNGIYNDANISGSILALGTLVSLYLVQTGKQWWERLAACVLLSASAVGVLLSVSRGAILCFGVSLIVWLAAEGKETRLRLFLLMVVSGGVCFAAFAPASAMIAPGAVLPNVLAVGSGGVIFLLDRAVVDRVAGVLRGRGKAMAVIGTAVIICISIFAVVSLNLTEPYELKSEGDYLYRAASLEPGEYTMSADSNTGDTLNVDIFCRSERDALMDKNQSLYEGLIADAVFTVPDGAVQTYFVIRGDKGSIINSVTISDGTELPMKYKLLPESIAYRLQVDFFRDYSYLVRVQYMKDALKLFAQKPFFGHGLGSTDNLYPTVQPFYYTSRYVHNHILQIMSDMGLLGLLSFLAFIGGALWFLVKQLWGDRDSLAAVLLACWVMINTHSLMEINFSVQAYQCVALILLLLPVVCYGKPLSETMAKIGAVMVCVIFWVYLAVFGWFLGQRQTVKRESANLQVFSIGEAISAMERFAAGDIFEPEGYQVQYILMAVQDTTGQYDAKMMEFVEKLRYSGNYPACSALPAGYYLKISDFQELFACSRDCMLQRASYALIWNEEVEFYRNRVLPAAGAEHADEFAEGVLAFQALLDEVNQDRIEEIVLDKENQAFLDLVAEAAAAELSGAGLYDYLIYAMGRDGIS